MKSTKAPELVKAFRGKNAHGHVYKAEALEYMSGLPRESADLVFLDPPFNLGKTYGRSSKRDKQPEAEYSRWLLSIAQEAARVLAPGGSLFLYHVPNWGLKIGAILQERLQLRHWIAVSMKNGFARGRRLYPAHYALLYFTKGEPQFFQRPRLPVERCRKCNETIRDYGGYRAIIESKGLNLTDVWTDLSPVRHKTQKTRRANELSLRMTNRIMSIAGFPGGIFLDPFCGSGAAVASAALAGMHFIASDLSTTNCKLTVARVRKLTKGRNSGGK